MTELQERLQAETLWEELGGDLCICQRLDVSHWCEKCQQRIDLISSALLKERDCLAALSRSQPSQDEAKQAHEYLSRLLTNCAPECEPLPDLLGLCTQIDNLLTGWSADRAALSRSPVEPEK